MVFEREFMLRGSGVPVRPDNVFNFSDMRVSFLFTSSDNVSRFLAATFTFCFSSFILSSISSSMSPE